MSIRHSITGLARLAAFAAALLLAAGGASAESVLRIGTNVGPVTFDPIRTNANADIWVFNNMNAFLVRSSPDATEIVPDLAERWEISDDRLTYTFHLRDAKFSDGSPITRERRGVQPDPLARRPGVRPGRIPTRSSRRSTRPIPGPWSSP